MSRQDQAEIRVTVDGVSLGVWDSMSGGAMDSEEVRYRPGGLADEVSLGGPRTQTEIEVMRLVSRDRDDWALIKWLMAKAGKATATVVKTPLDPDGSAVGEARTHRGTLKAVTDADHDSQSSDPARYTITVTPTGVPT